MFIIQILRLIGSQIRHFHNYSNADRKAVKKYAYR